MFKLLKKIIHIVYGERVNPSIQRFIDLNSKHWKDIKGSIVKGYILMTLKDSATNHVLSSRSVKAIEEETGCLPLAFLNSFSFLPDYRTKIYRSFNINNFIYYKNFLFNWINIFSALFATVRLFLSRPRVEDLLKLEFDEIYVGDLIYDTILRNNLGLYTINKIRWSYYKYIFIAFLNVKIYQEIFRKFKIKYIYSGLIVFIKGGIPARVADKNGAIVLVVKRNLMKNYQGLDICEGQYRQRQSDLDFLLNKSKRISSDVDKYLAKRFAGDIPEMDALKSYKAKNYYSKENLVKELDIRKEKPTVFIMAHAFSDGPHHTPTDKLIFRDFYVWLTETIKYVSRLDNANWIVKPHPLAPKYKEEGVVKKLVEKFGNNNVYLAPDDFNTKSIKDIAHAIVTVQGKAALEFGCYGIPSIITSYASYGGYGIMVEPKTKKEYFDILTNVGSVTKLNDKQITLAKVLTAIMFIYSRTYDPLYPPSKKFIYSRMNEEERWKRLAFLIKGYSRSEDKFYQRIKDLINLKLYDKCLR